MNPLRFLSKFELSLVVGGVAVVRAERELTQSVVVASSWRLKRLLRANKSQTFCSFVRSLARSVVLSFRTCK